MAEEKKKKGFKLPHLFFLLLYLMVLMVILTYVLPAGQFVRCNRCYLVNMAFVRAVRGHRLVLDMDELQISRPKRAAVLDALNNYLGGGF